MKRNFPTTKRVLWRPGCPPQIKRAYRAAIHHANSHVTRQLSHEHLCSREQQPLGGSRDQVLLACKVRHARRYKRQLRSRSHNGRCLPGKHKHSLTTNIRRTRCACCFPVPPPKTTKPPVPYLPDVSIGNVLPSRKINIPFGFPKISRGRYSLSSISHHFLHLSLTFLLSVFPPFLLFRNFFLNSFFL